VSHASWPYSTVDGDAMESGSLLQPQARAIDMAEPVAMYLQQGHHLFRGVGIVPPVDDVSFERQPVLPELPHFCKVLEAVATGKQFAFIREHELAIDPYRRRAEFYLLNPGAGRTHQQPRAFAPQAGVEMQRVPGLVRMHSDRANGVRLIAGENLVYKTRFEVVYAHGAPTFVATNYPAVIESAEALIA
jgi:hypothetical protein